MGMHRLPWAQQVPCGGVAPGFDPDRPSAPLRLTAVNPKRTHSPWHKSAIADLHCAGRELVRCGTELPISQLRASTLQRRSRPHLLTSLHRQSQMRKRTRTDRSIRNRHRLTGCGWSQTRGADCEYVFHRVSGACQVQSLAPAARWCHAPQPGRAWSRCRDGNAALVP